MRLYLFLCDDGQGEIKKEMERRKMGKEMLDYKRKNEDEKTKRIMDERSREKAEEKAARERVKAQIALVNKCIKLSPLGFKTHQTLN